MRKLLLGAALASTCLTAPALARDGALYIELDGGVMKVEDIDFDVGAVNNAVSLDHDVGYDFGAIVGYDFGAFRIEGEASFREADLDKIGRAVGPNLTNVRGDSSALSFMANALADFGPDDGLQFFAGGGVGYARVDVEAAAPGIGAIDDHDWGFAWQLLAGVRAPVTDTIDAGVKYRFFNASDVELNGGFDGRWRSHSLLGTVAYNFGGAEPMPEVIPPPPPPPPPVYTPPPPPPPPPVYTPPPPPSVGERG